MADWIILTSDAAALLGTVALYCGPGLLALAFTMWVIASIAAIIGRDACCRRQTSGIG